MGQSASLVRWLRLRRCRVEEGVFKHFFLYFAAVGDVRVGTLNKVAEDEGRNGEPVPAAHSSDHSAGTPAVGILPEDLGGAGVPIISA